MRRGFFVQREPVNIPDIFDIGQCNRGKNSHGIANAKQDRQARKLQRSRAEAAKDDKIKSDRVHVLSLADEPDPVQNFNKRLLGQASGGSKH
jgi:hypothetical protein